MCIIRSTSRARGLQRIIETGGSYGIIISEKDLRRVEILGTKDLALPNLGLPDDEWERIKKMSLTCVIHNAAFVNWFQTYNQLKSANVGPTLVLGSLAAETGAKFCYVSSVSTLPLANPELAVGEDTPNS